MKKLIKIILIIFFLGGTSYGAYLVFIGLHSDFEALAYSAAFIEFMIWYFTIKFIRE